MNTIRTPHAAAGSVAFFQAAWVVTDLDTAVRHWAAQGVGPFLVFRNIALEFTYRGVPAAVELSFALGQAGPIQIELICQHEDRPSAYRDSFREGESGLHHLGRIISDYDASKADFVAQGLEVAMEGNQGGVKYGYIDTRAQIGCMTELVQPTAANLELYEKVRRAGDTWDGRDPILELNLANEL
jgi:hypothetical protein